MAAQLATSAADRLLSGFRPSTLRQYRRMWRDFLAFQVAAGLLPSQVTAQMLLSFMEFLHCNALSSGSNYLTALRALYIVYGLDTSAFRDERLPLFIKSLRLQASLKPKLVLSLDIELLQRIVCENLRLSNLLPHSVNTFDHTRQLAKMYPTPICAIQRPICDTFLFLKRGQGLLLTGNKQQLCGHPVDIKLLNLTSIKMT